MLIRIEFIAILLARGLVSDSIRSPLSHEIRSCPTPY